MICFLFVPLGLFQSSNYVCFEAAEQIPPLPKKERKPIRKLRPRLAQQKKRLDLPTNPAT